MMTNKQSSSTYYADGQYYYPAGAGSNDANSAEEWLNLSLGGGHHDDTTSYGHGHHVSSSVTTPSKFFKCKYCTRKFLNSRALGGHQNAHKKERGEVRRFHMERSLVMAAGMPNYQKPRATTVLQSVGVEPHAGAHGYEHSTRPNWRPPQGYVEEGSERMTSWPGSFRLNSSSSSFVAFRMGGDHQSRSADLGDVPSLNQQTWQNSQLEDQLDDVSLDLSL